VVLWKSCFTSSLVLRGIRNYPLGFEGLNDITLPQMERETVWFLKEELAN